MTLQLQPMSVDVACPACAYPDVRLTEHDTENSDHGTVHVLRGECPGQGCTTGVEARLIEPSADELHPVQHGLGEQAELVAPARVVQVQADPPMFEFRAPTWRDGEQLTRVKWWME